MSMIVPVHGSAQSETPNLHSAQSASSPTPSADPVVAVCATHADADVAVRALGRSGFDMKKLSVIGKGYHTTDHPSSTLSGWILREVFVFPGLTFALGYFCNGTFRRFSVDFVSVFGVE